MVVLFACVQSLEVSLEHVTIPHVIVGQLLAPLLDVRILALHRVISQVQGLVEVLQTENLTAKP